MGEDRLESQAVLSPGEAASAFDAILHALSRVISPVLIDGAGWNRLFDAVSGLPVDPGVGFGFELRLGEPVAETDFYIAMPRGSSLGDHYVRLGQRAPPGSVPAQLGERLAAIETDAPWSDILGVEFDAASSPTGSFPGLFVRIRSELAEARGGGPGAEEIATWLTGAVGWRLAAGEVRALNRTFDGIAAAGGSVDCLGIMPGRPDRAFKVNSRPIEPARAVQVLERLQWRGPVVAVAAFLSRYEGLFRTLRLAVGVNEEGVLPRIGLELFQGQAATLSHPGAGVWPPFLDRLCEERLCLPQKMEGLLAWPGREFVFYGREMVGVLTGIANMKVSFEQRERGAAVEAKAYPAAGYLPFETVKSRFALR